MVAAAKVPGPACAKIFPAMAASWGHARPSERSQETLCWRQGRGGPLGCASGVGLRGRRETMRRTSSPPLCITLYYGYRATDGWRWKQPDGTACSWRRRVSAAAHLTRGNTGCPGQPRQFAAANALLLSLVKRSTTVSRSCARWTPPAWSCCRRNFSSDKRALSSRTG